jgi:hypothetical protein
VVVVAVTASCGGTTSSSDGGDAGARLPNHPSCATLEMGQQQTPTNDLQDGIACGFGAMEGARCTPYPGATNLGTCRSVSTLNRVGLDEYVRNNRVPLICLSPRPPACFGVLGATLQYACVEGTTCWGATDDAGTNGLCVPLPCNR